MSRFARFAQWFNSDRFKYITRPYTAQDLKVLLPPIRTRSASNEMSRRLYSLLRGHQKNGSTSYTFGALDPISVSQMAPHLDTVYISGWQASSVSPGSVALPGPDIGDYTYDTIPGRVQLLHNAMEFHQTKNNYLHSIDPKANPAINYLIPIIADADNSLGGLTTMMKMTKLFIQNGVSGIHIEDQRLGQKKCGHLGSKCLSSVQEQINRLIAARLQADLLQNELVIIGRIDAESALYLDNDIDPRDHPFILGKIQGTDKICTVAEAKEYLIKIGKISASDANNSYKKYFSWNDHRTSEGFYHVKNGMDACLNRAISTAPYCDMIWMETSKPDYNQAKEFAERVKEKVPHMMLAYNLSPSFNWSKSGMTDKQIKDFIHELGKLGYNWQFMTLANMHVNALAINRFVKQYKEDGVLGYVENIQRKELEENVDVYKHQRWAGIDAIDKYVSLITNNQSSTLGNSKGITEEQFK